MPAVACLIADPKRQPLDRMLLDEAAEILAPRLQPAEAAVPLKGLVHGLPLDRL